jgi:hypothetical protein
MHHIRFQVRPNCRLCGSNNVYCNHRGRQTTGQGKQGSINQSRGQGTGRQAGSGSGQAEVGNPEVEQRYRTAGRLRGRDRQSGQAGGYRVRTVKGQ